MVKLLVIVAVLTLFLPMEQLLRLEQVLIIITLVTFVYIDIIQVKQQQIVWVQLDGIKLVVILTVKQ